MAVESATDRAVFVNADEFGLTASYTPTGGSASDIDGIFDNGYLATSVGGESVGIQNAVAAFTCRSADLPGGAADGDAIEISGTAYIVRQIEPDGQGMSRLVLEKA